MHPRLVVLQPTPYCNIDCEYCYLRSRDDRSIMSRDVVDAVRNKIFTRFSSDAEPTVVWHAGEPTVVPIAWFEYATNTLRSAAPANTTFSLQSNGISISEAWIDFLERSGT